MSTMLLLAEITSDLRGLVALDEGWRDIVPTAASFIGQSAKTAAGAIGQSAKTGGNRAHEVARAAADRLRGFLESGLKQFGRRYRQGLSYGQRRRAYAQIAE